jgi:hypothetical protein
MEHELDVSRGFMAGYDLLEGIFKLFHPSAVTVFTDGHTTCSDCIEVFAVPQ